MEETEEKSGKRTSADPKQKTQPDGDEESCQYGSRCDVCGLLCGGRTGKKARPRKMEEVASVGQEAQELGPEHSQTLSESTTKHGYIQGPRIPTLLSNSSSLSEGKSILTFSNNPDLKQSN